MTQPVVPNPFYIDADAKHEAFTLRALAHAGVKGQEGVLGETHLGVSALATPGGQVAVAPGVYSILNTGQGGEFEAYVGKIRSQVTADVNPTDSSGSRTDLVIARIENPHAVGTGTWSAPADVLNGPYAHIRVIEGITPTDLANVHEWNAQWSAITLARITRPASKGIVEQADITDLRSLVDLGGQRVTGPGTPPIAQDIYSNNVHASSGSVLPGTNNTYINWPTEAVWQVPIPAWATGADVICFLQPQTSGHVWGYARLVIDGFTGVATSFDDNAAKFLNTGGGYRPLVNVGGTYVIDASSRGRQVEVRLQARQRAGEGFTLGDLVANAGTYVTFFMHFKRFPIYD